MPSKRLPQIYYAFKSQRLLLDFRNEGALETFTPTFSADYYWCILFCLSNVSLLNIIWTPHKSSFKRFRVTHAQFHLMYFFQFFSYSLPWFLLYSYNHIIYISFFLLRIDQKQFSMLLHSISEHNFNWFHYFTSSRCTIPLPYVWTFMLF